MSKQLVIIKHTAPGAARKPLSSIYSTKSTHTPYGAPAPARRPLSAGGAKKGLGTLLNDTNEGELREIISTLKRECTHAAERLKLAQKDSTAKGHTKDGAEEHDRAMEGKSAEELKKAVRDMKARTTMLEATEEHRMLICKEAKDASDRTEPMIGSFRDELADLQRKIVDLTHQKKLVELRKGEHDEISAQIVKLRVAQDELEDENRRLRTVAFSAGEVIVTVTHLANEQEELSEENETSRQQLEDLSKRNIFSEKALAELESDSHSSISKLQGRGKEHAAKAKLLTREIQNLREKLSTFIGGESGGQMDQGSVREARLLAQRMGVPMYMRATGSAGDTDQNLDDLRREIRRLKVLQASELREIGKLRQMANTQEHLMRHTVSGSAEGEKELARIRRVYNNKVAAMQRRISDVESKNERLGQLLAKTRVDKLAAAAHSAEASALSSTIETAGNNVLIRQHQLVAGRGVVSVLVDGLVLNRDYGDFSRNEPTTLLVLEFYLHDIQHSSPMRGLAPDGALKRDLEVSLDDLFLHFLYYDKLQLQLVLVRGLDFDTIAVASLPLRALVEGANSSGPSRMDVSRLELFSSDDAAGGAGAARRSVAAVPVGYVNIVVQVQARIAEQARNFLARQQATSSPSTIQRSPSAAQDRAREKTCLLEDFPRHVGCTYVLIVKLVSISNIAAMPTRRSGTGGGDSTAPRARRRFLAMHQLLDFPVNETDTLSVVEGSQASLFAAGAAPYKIPASPDWDRRMLAGRLEIVLLDQSDPSDDVVGTAEIMLAPLISRRGVTATVLLYDAGGQVSASMAVEVAWEPEPLFETAGGLSAREMDAIQERLAVIRTWIRHLGLGDLEAATKALYESWENRNGDVATDGLSRAHWVGILRQVRDGAAKEAVHKDVMLQSITEAEMMAVFNYLTEQDGGGGNGSAGGGKKRNLTKAQLVSAIVAGPMGGRESGGTGSQVGVHSSASSVNIAAAVQGVGGKVPSTSITAAVHHAAGIFLSKVGCLLTSSSHF